MREASKCVATLHRKIVGEYNFAILKAGSAGARSSSMKTTLLLSSAAACLAVLLVPSVSSAAITKYKVKFDAAQVTPPTDSPATGTALLDFDDEKSELTGQVDLVLTEGTKVTGQYVHVGKCGSSGPSKMNLTEPGLNGVIVIDPPKKLDATMVEALQKGELYINIRTEKFPTGEIRGQILPESGNMTCPATAETTENSNEDVAGGNGGGTADNNASASDDKGGCNASGGESSFSTIALGGIAALLIAARRKRR